MLELPERLKGRPDARARCTEFHRRFLDFVPGDSRRSQEALAGFAKLVGESIDPPFRHAARMRRQLEEISRVLERKEKLDRYLDEEDRRRAPARRGCRVRLECIEELNASSSLLSEAARRWVDGREAEFR